jgi:hypothetical protein
MHPRTLARCRQSRVRGQPNHQQTHSAYMYTQAPTQAQCAALLAAHTPQPPCGTSHCSHAAGQTTARHIADSHGCSRLPHHQLMQRRLNSDKRRLWRPKSPHFSSHSFVVFDLAIFLWSCMMPARDECVCGQGGGAQWWCQAGVDVPGCCVQMQLRRQVTQRRPAPLPPPPPRTASAASPYSRPSAVGGQPGT